MTPIDSIRFIERVRFFNDERLIAPDLQDIDDFARQMRWLHNRSLHQPGVANGFTVTGEKDDRQVVVQPGYALDALGREIVLTQSFTQPVPPTAGNGLGAPASYDLTVAYPSTLTESESRTADCGVTRGTVRQLESPVFCWASVSQNDSLRDDIESGMRIVLARADVLNCKLYNKVSVAPRTEARPSVHPFIYAALTTPKWVVTTSPFGTRIAPSIPVDARAAGFRTTPCYFASLATETNVTIKGQTIRLDISASVSFPTTSGFQVSFLIPNLPLLLAGISPDQVRTALDPSKWQLSWMGVEA